MATPFALPSPQEQAAILLKVAGMAQMAQLSQITALILFTYDYFTSFKQETKSIWTQRWTLPKILFIIVRYYGLFMFLIDVIATQVAPATSAFCRGWLYFAVIQHIIYSAIFANFLFLLRLSALYGRTKFVYILLGAVYVIEGSLISLDQILNPPKPLIVKMGIGAVQACVAGNKHGKTALITQCFCLFRAVLYLGMTIYKWNNYVIAGDQDQASRSVTQRMMSRDGSGRRLAPLLRLFVRDEAVVFTVIVVLQSVQASFAISDGLHMYAGSVFTWFQVLLAICALRLVLNVHDYFGTGGARGSVSAGSARPLHVSMIRTHDVHVSKLTTDPATSWNPDRSTMMGGSTIDKEAIRSEDTHVPAHPYAYGADKEFDSEHRRDRKSGSV